MIKINIETKKAAKEQLIGLLENTLQVSICPTNLKIL
jgi:hypothetical protein